METPKHLLAEKIARRKAKVGVIGLGYVGLPFALETVKAGLATQGIDLNPQRVTPCLRDYPPFARKRRRRRLP